MPIDRQNARCRDRQEIARVVELGDQHELFFKGVAYMRRNAIGETPGGTGPSQIFEVGLRRLAFRHRLIGIFVAKLIEGEATGFGDLDGAGKCLFVAFEQARHFFRRFQMPLGIRFELKTGFVDGAFLADAGEHVLQDLRWGA